MSGPEQYERVTVSSEGVAVEKRFEEDEFPVPAIAFEIRSSRSEAVRIVLADRVPEGVAVEDLGFHPEYGSEHWTIDEDRITFEREIEAESEYTTVYGIRATGTDDVEQFLTEPVVEEVDPPLPEDADPVVDEGGSDVVRDVISGTSDTVPGIDEDDESDEDVEKLDLKDPNAPDDGSGAGGAGASLENVDAATLVGAMADELRNGNVDEEDVKLLRKAFDVAGDDSGSVEARIKHLQTEIADLLAYTDALEEFLDENGTAEQTIEEFRTEVESLQSDLREVEGLARSHEEVISEVRSTVEGVEESVASIESEMDEVVEEVEAVKSDVSEVEGTVADVEGTVDEMDETVADVEADVEELETRVGDIDIEGVREDVDEVETEIEDLKNWRKQLSSVIGGGGD